MKKIDNILEQLKTDRKEIERTFKVRSIGVFGSYVRNEQRKHSDLDVLVDYRTVPGLFDFLRLEEYLSDRLGVKVDLVMKSALKPGIGKRILEEVQYI